MKHYTLYRYTLAYHHPFPERSGLILFDEDSQGWGEIAPLPGRSKETLLEAEEQVLSVLKGRPPAGSLFPSVAFGLSSAKCKNKEQKNIPLSLLLAGDCKQILAKAASGKSQGFTSAKLKIASFSLEEAAELIEHLRTLFFLRIDANRAFSFREAIALFEQCGVSAVDYIEEPTYELDKLEELPFPFALDESLLELDALPATPYFKTIVCKPSIISLEKYKDLEKQGKQIVLSSACETGVGILGIAGLAARLPEMRPVGLDTYRYLPQDILISPLDFSTGSLSLPFLPQVNTALLQEIAHG